jgi:serine/threonine-protein kinase HipA
MAYYLMAKACGIEMTECRLLEENGRAHFMTKRFDREEGDIKHHIQTFCAMQHFDFNNVNSYSYEQLFQTMRLLKLPYLQAEQMFRRMVFNVMARNCDDHTKNFAFRLRKNQDWELTPAYDICHAFRPGSEWVSEQALSINGKRSNISKEDIVTIAKSMNIKKGTEIIQRTSEIIKKWADFAEETKVEPKLKEAIKSTLITF